MTKTAAQGDPHLKTNEDALIFLFDSTNHIVDAGKDDGGQLGSVSPLRDEGEGEGVHKQLTQAETIQKICFDVH